MSTRFSFRRVLLEVLALCVLGAIAYGVQVYSEYKRFADAPITGISANTAIDVPLGLPLPGVVKLLDTRGFAPGNAYYWRFLAREMGVAGKLHAGEYALEPGLTPRKLLQKMAAGEVIQHHFTIVEGWTFAQLCKAIGEDAGLIQSLGIHMGEFTKDMSKPEAISSVGATVMKRLGEPEALPEGQFLPETYSYVKGMTDFDILRRAHEALKRELNKAWNQHAADTPLTSPYQALTLASIVEKETGRADERPQIARVFLSRLKLGMKLQTDPTVIYGMGASYDGNIRKRDLETDTPFNTYTRYGLPPTPIALPGKAALDAVVHPAATPALYFVARGDGSHEFSPTLEAHNRAVAKFQLHR